MKDELNVAGAPSVLILENGKELRMSPLTDRDIAELDQWVQARLIQNARKSLPPDATQADRDETLRLAMQESLTVSWLTGVGAKMMLTVDGIARLAWQGVHKNHPDITLDQLQTLMFKEENVKRAYAAFKRANPPASGPVKGPPRPARRGRK